MLPSMLKSQDSHSSLEWARDLPLLYTTPLNFGLHDHTWLGASLCLYKKMNKIIYFTVMREPLVKQEKSNCPLVGIKKESEKKWIDWLRLGLVNASEPGELVMARVAMNHDGDWQEREKSPSEIFSLEAQFWVGQIGQIFHQKYADVFAIACICDAPLWWVMGLQFAHWPRQNSLSRTTCSRDYNKYAASTNQICDFFVRICFGPIVWHVPRAVDQEVLALVLVLVLVLVLAVSEFREPPIRWLLLIYYFTFCGDPFVFWRANRFLGPKFT